MAAHDLLTALQTAPTWSAVRRALVLGLTAACGLGGPAVALDPAKSLSQYVERNWATADGLPQSSVTAITQSADGYLWVGTFGGLARFDGVRFRTYGLGDGLPSLRVVALYADRGGGLWVGTEDAGAVRLHPDSPPRALGSREGLPRGVVWGFAEDARDELWVATGDGLCHLRDGRCRLYATADGLPGHDVTALAADQDGLWVGTRGGLARVEAGTLTPVPLDGPAGFTWIHDLALDAGGGLWLATGGGLARLSGGQVRLWPAADAGLVGAVAVDGHGGVWWGDGVLRRLTGAAPNADPALEVKAGHAAVRALFVDQEGSLWLGTDGDGLVQLVDGPITPLRAQQGIPAGSILVVAEGPPGVFWVGSQSGGLARVEGGRGAPVRGPRGEPLQGITALLPEADGTLWVAADRQLLRLDPAGSGARFGASHGLPATDLRVLSKAGGTLIVGSDLGLGRFDGTGYRHLAGVEDGVEPPVSALLLDGQGGLWVGARNGLFRVAPGLEARPDPVLGALQGAVRALWQDGESEAGALWVGTYGGGLARYAAGRWAYLGSAQGLPGDTVSHIAEDGLGYLWLSGNAGLARISRAELEAVADGRARRLAPRLFGVGDGMPSSECNGGSQPSGWRAADGTLWFPTIAGVAAVDPRRLLHTAAGPPVSIEQVLVAGEPRHHRGELSIAPRSAPVEIHFTAPSFLAPESLSFRHRLEGFEEGWQEVGERRVAYYTGVPPGRYRFRVAASLDQGPWGADGTPLVLVVSPRFVETPWFAALILGVVGAATGSLYQFRLHRLRRRELELEKLVATRTAELAAHQRELESLNANLSRMVAEQTQEIRDTRDMAVLTLAKLAELRDAHTGRHLERIAIYCRCLARALAARGASEIDEGFVEQLAKSSALHDVGKVAIPDAILNKAGPLTPEERQVIQRHAEIGGSTLRSVLERYDSTSFLAMGMEIAQSHHERWDGTGYPLGLAGEAIPLAARIVALADAYDAITSERPYKPALPHEEAVQRILRDRGRHFDPRLVDAFDDVHQELARLRDALPG